MILNKNNKILTEHLTSRKNVAILVLSLLLILVFVASSPLFYPGFYISHESTNPIQRVLAMTYEIENGFYYPRWLSLSYCGMGSPFSNFYSPGFYLSAAYMHIIGVPLLTSIKLLIGGLFFLGAAGMFLWTRQHYSTSGALLSSVLYIFAPYHFVDIYVRGAMAEFSALAFLPFLFLGIDFSFSAKNRFCGMFLVAFASASILIFHHLSAVLIAPFALLYFTCSSYLSRAGFALTLRAMSGPLMGIGLSAFYWLPVLLERRYLKWFEDVLTTGYYSYSNHFVYVWQLVSTYWGFGGSNPGPIDGMSFQIGLTILIFTIVAVFTLIHSKPGSRGYPLVFLLLGALAVFLTTKASSWIYGLFPWFSFVQFPWRFLGPATLFLSAFAGLTANAVDSVRALIKGSPWITVLLAIGLCLVLSANQISVSSHQTYLAILNSKNAEKNIIDKRSLGSLCEKDEYLPRWVSARIPLSWQFFQKERVITDSRIRDLSIRGARMSFCIVANSGGAVVTIPWFYFPGWRVLVDGNDIPIVPNRNGFLSFSLPGGRHTVMVRFGSSVARIAGWCITLLTFSAITGCLLYAIRRRKRVRVEKYDFALPAA